MYLEKNLNKFETDNFRLKIISEKRTKSINQQLKL